MKIKFKNIAFFVFALIPFFTEGQQLSSDDIFINEKVVKLRHSLQCLLDSLNENNNVSSDVQQKLDSLNTILTTPSQTYNELLALDQLVKVRIKNKYVNLDTLSSINQKINKSVSSDVGTSIAKDLNQGRSTLRLAASTELPEIPSIVRFDGVNSNFSIEKIPDKNFTGPIGQLSGKVDDLQTQSEKINEVAQRIGNFAQNANEYTKEIRTLYDTGLIETKKLTVLAEQQAAQLEEVKALKVQEAVSTKQLEEYKRLIEQYKEEKRIHEQLKEKTKELATEEIIANQVQSNDVIKKIDKSRRKFSHVYDIRNLPKRAPNPMKEVTWRERVVPGLTFQTISGSGTWLEFDPQVYYKINGNLSAGVGGMYRFSMNPGKFTFDDFGSMTGAKIFAQYHIVKGFFVRGEGQYVRWKPWELKLTDPTYVDHTYVAAAGIGKSYQIVKKIKGNIQTLYHFHWEGMDPYKPKVMVRIGFDFSLKKREPKHWENRLKERKHEEKQKQKN